MYGVIRTYTYDRKDGALLAKINREEFLPLVEAQDGFHEYHWIDTGDGEGASMAIFDSKESAEASTFLAGGYVHDRVAQYIHNPPHIIEGPL